MGSNPSKPQPRHTNIAFQCEEEKPLKGFVIVDCRYGKLLYADDPFNVSIAPGDCGSLVAWDFVKRVRDSK